MLRTTPRRQRALICYASTLGLLPLAVLDLPPRTTTGRKPGPVRRRTAPPSERRTSSRHRRRPEAHRVPQRDQKAERTDRVKSQISYLIAALQTRHLPGSARSQCNPAGLSDSPASTSRRVLPQSAVTAPTRCPIPSASW